ncbi:MAG TPA: hypothetical protein VFE62_17520, partial [Gemmataceae bacterium]|nr:hypothetical protein [Gemmataceae bacterium]
LAAQAARRCGELESADRHLVLAAKLGVPRDAFIAEQNFLAIQTGDLSGAGPLMQLCEDRPESAETALALEAIIEGSLKMLQLPLAKASIEFWLKHRTRKFDQARGLVWKGRLQMFAMNLPGAVADLRQAVELAPDYVPGRLMLVEALLRDDPRQALPHLNWLNQRQPNDVEIRLQTARARRNLAEPEEAGKILDDILIAQPKNVAALIERGRVALDLNRPDDAKRWLLSAYEIAPNQRDVLLALSDCSRQMNLLDDAKRYRDQAQEIEDRLLKQLGHMTGRAQR